MKKIFALALAALLIVTGFGAASAAPGDQMKALILADFKGSTSQLTSAQKNLITSSLASFPLTEKVTCVGLVFQNINSGLARARATAVCDFIASKNPLVVTFATSTKTPIAKESAQVEVQFKWSATASVTNVVTDTLDFKINPAYKVGKSCTGRFAWQVVGLDSKGKPAFLKCSKPYTGKFVVDSKMFRIDPATMRPVVSSSVPQKTYFAMAPHVYIEPQISSDVPLTSISQSSQFENVEPCRLAAGEDNVENAGFGFPIPAHMPRLREGFKIAVVPVSFLDHPAKTKPADDFADVKTALTNYYQRISTKKISFEWDIPEKYFAIPKNIDDFKLISTEKGDFWPSNAAYIQFVVDQVDENYDFSKYDVVIFEEVRTVTDKEHPQFVPWIPLKSQKIRISSDEGEIDNLIVSGGDQTRDIQNWLHEFGHNLGLTDRNWKTDSKPGFDLMFGWYGSPEMSAWNRWLLGVQEDKQIDCKTDSGTSTHLIRPIAWQGSVKKAVVIPVSKYEALVVESRRRLGYDALFGKESEGAYVYRINTNTPIYESTSQKPVDVIRPARSKALMDWALDAALDPGESVTSDGWRITVKEAGNFGDVVEITKENG